MFWRENTVYPFAHYTVPLALYLASRSLWFSLFVMYFWESVETLIGQFVAASYKEAWYDRLIGDPLHGGTAIVTAWLADEAFCWSAPFQDDTSGWLRASFFVTIFVGMLLLVWPRPWIGVVAYGLWYVGALAAFFLPTADDTRTIQSIVAAMVVVGVQTLVVYWPLDDGPSYVKSRFSRSYLVSLATLAVVCFVGGAVGGATCGGGGAPP